MASAPLAPPPRGGANPKPSFFLSDSSEEENAPQASAQPSVEEGAPQTPAQPSVAEIRAELERVEAARHEEQASQKRADFRMNPICAHCNMYFAPPPNFVDSAGRFRPRCFHCNLAPLCSRCLQWHLDAQHSIWLPDGSSIAVAECAPPAPFGESSTLPPDIELLPPNAVEVEASESRPPKATSHKAA